MSDKPKPLKVFGRTHYACTRCKLSKIKCLGEKPACANCKAVNKEAYCQYPMRDRKIMIMELDLNKLQSRVEHLEELIRTQGPSTVHLPSMRPDSMVQRRVLNLLAQESYLLPDTENDLIPYRLLLLCADQLPDETYAWRLMDLVCKTYLSEFYLVDADILGPLVSKIYKFFRTTDLRNVRSADVLHAVLPISLCYVFVIMAFGEQMHNSTLERLPASIAKVTGGSSRIPGLEYYTTATKLFNLAHEEIDVQFIQSALLLGLFACNLNRYNTVYNYFGVALRSAVANGYHRQMKTPTYFTSDQLNAYRILEEKTKRLWWSVWVIDVVWAAKMNMPVHIDYTDTDVALPNESPMIDLNDGFNTEMLENNVHLVKYVSRLNAHIYGPNVRTFSVNYINTEKFNLSLLVTNILSSLSDIFNHFECSVLSRYKDVSIVLLTNRNLANLCLRYNQLVILVIQPLLSLVFQRASAEYIGHNEDVAKAIGKGVMAAIRTVKILMKMYEHNKLFVLGYWDSQHLFTALLILLAADAAGNQRVSNDYNSAIALIKYMADNNNINARNAMEKLGQVSSFLEALPELDLKLNLTSDITKYVTKCTPPLSGTTVLDEFFNPFTDGLIEEWNPMSDREAKPGELLYDTFGFSKLSEQSQATLWAMTTTVQSWDNYRGLPIHVSGTGRIDSQQETPCQSASGNDLRINNLI